MLVQIVQTQRARVTYQEAQDAVPGWQCSYSANKFRVDADSNEMAQRLVFLNDPQRTIAGIQKCTGGFHHPLEHRL